MRRIQVLLCCLAVGAVASCGDDSEVTEKNEAKLEASKLYRSGQAGGRPDLCTLHAWYGDGVCDDWCPRPDSDCTPADVACDAIFSLPDGKCDLSDPCSKVQDADCQVEEDAGVACSAIFSLADGKCDSSDPCAYVQDEDCVRSRDAGAPVVCPAIAYPRDGKCEPPAGCEVMDAIDCGLFACDAIRYADDGRCEAPAGCEASDPIDCKTPIACPAIYTPKDGVCPPDAPCDPDCAPTAANP